MFIKHRAAVCPFSLLLQVMDGNVSKGGCCHIDFRYGEQKHSIGVYGDDGNTYDNVRYYFDKEEYGTRTEMLEGSSLGGNRLSSFCGEVTVTECDGCYPESTPEFRPYLQKEERGLLC